MRSAQYFALLAVLVREMNALPLNINLGAYSPALVVGDGEISFGGQQDVTNLMNALEGAAVNAAASNVGGEQAVVTQTVAVSATVPGGQAGETRAAENPAAAEAAAVKVSDADKELAEQIAAMGATKELGPREPEITAAPVVKRDLTGFDRALKYAEVALTKGPNVQLGTGEGGSGVGIIVQNNPAAAVGGEAARTVGKRETEDELEALEDDEDIEEEHAKRDLEAEHEDIKRAVSNNKVKRKVTTVYVRSGVPEALNSALLERDSSDATSDAVAKRWQPVSATAPEGMISKVKRAVSEGIDAVNVNMDARDGLTMTFVETEEVE